jgi:hypothetical protein
MKASPLGRIKGTGLFGDTQIVCPLGKANTMIECETRAVRVGSEIVCRGCKVPIKVPEPIYQRERG